MLTLPTRPLILTCGAALALFELVALLPGNPDVASTRSFLGVVAAQTLIVWRLLRVHRGRLDVRETAARSSLLTLMQVGLLFTTPVLVYVFSEDDGAASHQRGG
jgi:hypothetical protein